MHEVHLNVETDNKNGFDIKERHNSMHGHIPNEHHLCPFPCFHLKKKEVNSSHRHLVDGRLFFSKKLHDLKWKILEKIKKIYFIQIECPDLNQGFKSYAFISMYILAIMMLCTYIMKLSRSS